MWIVLLIFALLAPPPAVSLSNPPASWTVQTVPARIAQGGQAALAVSIAPGAPAPEMVHIALPAGLVLEHAQASAGAFLGDTWTFTRTEEAPVLLLLSVRATSSAHRDSDVAAAATWGDTSLLFNLAFDPTPPRGCQALYIPAVAR